MANIPKQIIDKFRYAQYDMISLVMNDKIQTIIEKLVKKPLRIFTSKNVNKVPKLECRLGV